MFVDNAQIDRISGSLVGLAVGDALGAPLEFMPREVVRQQYPNGLREMIPSALWHKGEYTDDTETALLLSESLLSCGRFDSRDFARRIQRWAQNAKDVGAQMSRVIQRPSYTTNPEKVVQEDYADHPDQSAGNGALMRCVPVALFCLNSPELLVEYSRASAAVTHGDPKAHSACVLLNGWIREAIIKHIRDARDVGIRMLLSEERVVWRRFRAIERYEEPEIRSTGYTVDTLEAAAWAFLTTGSFADAVICGANLGDDADTVAAVAGALAGAFYGYSAIPRRWLEQLKEQDRIRSTAIRLAQAGMRTTT